MPNKITKGSIERLEKEKINKAKKNEEQRNKKEKIINDNLFKVKSSSFKKIIIDFFLKEFSNNYGKYFDYNSLVNSIVFTNKESKMSDRPIDFKFNESNVLFKSDFDKINKKFNENSYKNFISNEDDLNGINIDYKFINNNLEYTLNSNNKNNIDYKEVYNYDGRFIPVSSDNERYGNFNRINKNLGYTPVNVSAETATKEAINFWNKNMAGRK